MSGLLLLLLLCGNLIMITLLPYLCLSTGTLVQPRCWLATCSATPASFMSPWAALRYLGWGWAVQLVEQGGEGWETQGGLC